MRKITLGRTKIRVSVVSLGTWSYGGANTSGGRPVGWAGQEEIDSKVLIQMNLQYWQILHKTPSIVYLFQ